MVLMEYQGRLPDFRFDILGTDISTDALEKAVQGIYAEAKAEPNPGSSEKNIFSAQKTHRIVPYVSRRRCGLWSASGASTSWMTISVFGSLLISSFVVT